jgi:hypothetical protein
VKNIVLTFLTVIASAAPSYAVDRYYCAADDSQLKMSIETGFEESPEWPLSNMRGIVVFKPGQGKTLEGILKIGADDVVQYLRDGQSMMIRTSSETGVDKAATHVDLTVDTKQETGNINHFIGNYKIVVRPLGKKDPSLALTRKGKVACARL